MRQLSSFEKIIATFTICALILGVIVIWREYTPASAATTERYQVADVFPIGGGRLGIIQAAPGSEVFDIKEKLARSLKVSYDAPSKSKMWREGNRLHLVRGYQIGAGRTY